MAPTCVSTPTFCVVCLATIFRLSLIVPCYKRVFVAECHNRYSEFLRQGSLHTRYAMGFGRETVGTEGGELPRNGKVYDRVYGRVYVTMTRR